jgi:hypothetical protein
MKYEGVWMKNQENWNLLYLPSLRFPWQIADENLVTPDNAVYCCAVESLQHSLHVKAKAKPDYRFYSLWDKVYRIDVLHMAYRQCKRNGGSQMTNGLNPRAYVHYILTKIHDVRMNKIDPKLLLPHAIDPSQLQIFVDEQLALAKQMLNSS